MNPFFPFLISVFISFYFNHLFLQLFSIIVVSQVIYKGFDYRNLWLKGMRTYILTDTEKKILETFLESQIKLDGFSVLILRLKKSQPELRKDLELIESVLKKLESPVHS